MTTRDRMRELGRKGGRKKSAAKTASSRRNVERARSVLASKRLALPPFNDGLRASDLPRPPAKNDNVSHLTALPHEPPPVPQPAPEPIEPEIVSELNSALKATPSVNHRWPPWPDPPVLRTPFQLAVREMHKFFSSGRCKCTCCVP
jgi:hypothetical protein